MKVYKSRRDWVFGSIFLGITLLFAVILVLSYFDSDFWDWMLIVFILVGINLIILVNFFFIKIKIKDEELMVSVIYNVFRINIFKITKIRIGETMWSGFHKCGTATGGLIIFSKNKNDLYITPENQDEFLKQLLEVNRHIIIDDVRK